MNQRLGKTLAAVVALVWLTPESPLFSQVADLSTAAGPAATGYVGASEPATSLEIYGQGVRETNWQTPEQEQAGFHLPHGFEIELFADEELITKPLNMAWDTRGRLWVTSTVEYPYPAKPNVVPRDTIRILEDTDGDGRADKVTVFADQLNIPMGLLPVRDGVICFSIPNLWYLKDTDGDDRVDQRIMLLGPFDTTRDTHGMVSSLSRGSDGWIYACHGFNNQSTVEAQDGSSVKLISGNTFRFRDDGTSIEQYTQGQVNPFGMTRDEWGNWYTADCHSKPLTALLPGACYPSFGRPHDGMGFAPDMMQHLHGSTAICGLTYYQAEHFPAAYRRLFYSGNVMTSRINCNAPRWQGATITAVEQADFMTSDDPWFRPVDIQLGPDGALYVADFYNKIIGHYEVPLEHPERDRESGRIWRIVYRGDRTHEKLTTLRDATSFARKLAEDSEPGGSPTSWEALLPALVDSNLTRRRLAIDAALQYKVPLPVPGTEFTPEMRISLLELAHRLGALQDADLLRLVKDPMVSPQELVLAFRLVAERKGEPNQELLQFARQKMLDRDYATLANAQVLRAAIELLGKKSSIKSGSGDAVSLLAFAIELSNAQGTPQADPALLHSTRLAIRQLITDEQMLKAVYGPWMSEPSTAEPLPFTAASMLVGILTAIKTEMAAEAMLGLTAEQVKQDPHRAKGLVDQAIEAASPLATPRLLGKLLPLIDQASEGKPSERATRFRHLCDAYRAQHGKLDPALQEYGVRLQRELIAALQQELSATGGQVGWLDNTGADWPRQSRSCADGQQAELVSSHPRGEQYTGILASETIRCPSELTFWLAGHNGPPNERDQQRNLIRLVHASTNSTLQVAFPPRNDQAQLFRWKLDEWEGAPVRIEVVDGDAGDAYAWLAVGRFSAPQLERGGASQLVEALASGLRQGLASDTTLQALHDAPLSPQQHGSLVVAALTGGGQQPLATLADFAVRLNRFDLLTASWLDSASDEQVLQLSRELCATATGSQQAGLAKSLMSSAAGCSLLNNLLDQGVLSLRALHGSGGLLPAGLDANVREALEKQLAAAASLPAESFDVAAKLAGLRWQEASLESGKQLFTQHCAVCHQLGNAGNLVGPQLDGAVVRGMQRLAEDILDPNRNVDKAFRLTALLMDDDSVVTGLVQDTEGGETVIVTGQDGKRTEYRTESIAQRRESSQSLMPSNFHEVLNDKQLADLLSYLLDAGKSPR